MSRARISELMRRVGAQSVLRSAIIAKKVGIAPSDLECLDLLYLDGPLNPGDIMAGTGLSSAAVTALCDRLARRGFIVRERDPADGRRTIISIDRAATAHIAAYYAGSPQRWSNLMDRFSDEELEVIRLFFEQALEDMRSIVNLLEQPADRGPDPVD